MPTSSRIRRVSRRATVLAGGLTALAAMSLTGCASGAAEAGSDGTTTVTLALSYLPGPEDNGLAYAVEEGLFEKAGITVDVVPYGETSSLALAASGAADFAITASMNGVIRQIAQGAPVNAVFAAYAHTPYKLGVLASSDIERPADLAGGTYGGFGDPVEAAIVNKMIENDGGSGAVDPVVLSVGSYDAVGSGAVDSALFYEDSIYMAQQAGNEIRTFSPSDYGLPDSYATVLVTNDEFLSANSDTARAFISAFAEGYAKALADPATADAALLEMFPGEVDPGLLEHVSAVQTDYLYPNADGPVGAVSMDRVEAEQQSLIDLGMLIDENNEPVSKPIDLSERITNEYLTSVN